MTDSLLFAFGFGVSVLTLAALYLAGIVRSLEKSAEELEGAGLPQQPGETKTTVPCK